MIDDWWWLMIINIFQIIKYWIAAARKWRRLLCRDLQGQQRPGCFAGHWQSFQRGVRRSQNNYETPSYFQSRYAPWNIAGFAISHIAKELTDLITKTFKARNAQDVLLGIVRWQSFKRCSRRSQNNVKTPSYSQSPDRLWNIAGCIIVYIGKKWTNIIAKTSKASNAQAVSLGTELWQPFQRCLGRSQNNCESPSYSQSPDTPSTPHHHQHTHFKIPTYGQHGASSSCLSWRWNEGGRGRTEALEGDHVL